MTAVLVTDEVVPAVNQGEWFYVRSWHCADHPQSGIRHTERVSQFLLLSEDAAYAAAYRMGLPEQADAVILSQWVDTLGAQ